jgi:hypothetical protein
MLMGKPYRPALAVELLEDRTVPSVSTTRT